MISNLGNQANQFGQTNQLDILDSTISRYLEGFAR